MSRLGHWNCPSVPATGCPVAEDSIIAVRIPSVMNLVPVMGTEGAVILVSPMEIPLICAGIHGSSRNWVTSFALFFRNLVFTDT